MCRTRGWGCGRIGEGLGSSEVREKQIPGENDRKKGKAEADPYGMTARKARATTKAKAIANTGVSPLRITKTRA